MGSWGSHIVLHGGVVQPPVAPEGRRFPGPELLAPLGCAPACGASPPSCLPASPGRMMGGCG